MSLIYCVFSLLCVLYSTCFIDLMPKEPEILDDYAAAQSYRFSHYFVCYISLSTVILSGMPIAYQTTKAMAIEFPRSLGEVVVYWNCSMHEFLHKCRLRSLVYSTLYSMFFLFELDSLIPSDLPNYVQILEGIYLSGWFSRSLEIMGCNYSEYLRLQTNNLTRLINNSLRTEGPMMFKQNPLCKMNTDHICSFRHLPTTTALRILYCHNWGFSDELSATWVQFPIERCTPLIRLLRLR